MQFKPPVYFYLYKYIGVVLKAWAHELAPLAAISSLQRAGAMASHTRTSASASNAA